MTGTGEDASLRERLARAQFDAEGHANRGGVDRWENLPEGNQHRRLTWADRVIDAVKELWHQDPEYQWSDVDTFMFSVLTRQAYEATHDRRPDYLLALDWVAEGWLPEDHPKRKQITAMAQASAACVDDVMAEQATLSGRREDG